MDRGAEAARPGLERLAADRVVGCGCRAAEHAYSHRVWQRSAWALGIIGGLGAALASISLFADETSLVAGIVAAASALAVLVSTVIRVPDTAQAHKIAHDAFSELTTDYRKVVDSTAKHAAFEELDKATKALEARHAYAQKAAPAPSLRANRYAAKLDERCERKTPAMSEVDP